MEGADKENTEVIPDKPVDVLSTPVKRTLRSRIIGADNANVNSSVTVNTCPDSTINSSSEPAVMKVKELSAINETNKRTTRSSLAPRLDKSNDQKIDSTDMSNNKNHDDHDTVSLDGKENDEAISFSQSSAVSQSGSESSDVRVLRNCKVIPLPASVVKPKETNKCVVVLTDISEETNTTCQNVCEKKDSDKRNEDVEQSPKSVEKLQVQLDEVKGNELSCTASCDTAEGEIISGKDTKFLDSQNIFSGGESENLIIDSETAKSDSEAVEEDVINSSVVNDSDELVVHENSETIAPNEIDNCNKKPTDSLESNEVYILPISEEEQSVSDYAMIVNVVSDSNKLAEDVTDKHEVDNSNSAHVKENGVNVEDNDSDSTSAEEEEDRVGTVHVAEEADINIESDSTEENVCVKKLTERTPVAEILHCSDNVDNKVNVEDQEVDEVLCVVSDSELHSNAEIDSEMSNLELEKDDGESNQITNGVISKSDVGIGRAPESWHEQASSLSLTDPVEAVGQSSEIQNTLHKPDVKSVEDKPMEIDNVEIGKKITVNDNDSKELENCVSSDSDFEFFSSEVKKLREQKAQVNHLDSPSKSKACRKLDVLRNPKKKLGLVSCEEHKAKEVSAAQQSVFDQNILVPEGKQDDLSASFGNTLKGIVKAALTEAMTDFKEELCNVKQEFSNVKKVLDTVLKGKKRKYDESFAADDKSEDDSGSDFFVTHNKRKSPKQHTNANRAPDTSKVITEAVSGMRQELEDMKKQFTSVKNLLSKINIDQKRTYDKTLHDNGDDDDDSSSVSLPTFIKQAENKSNQLSFANKKSSPKKNKHSEEMIQEFVEIAASDYFPKTKKKKIKISNDDEATDKKVNKKNRIGNIELNIPHLKMKNKHSFDIGDDLLQSAKQTFVASSSDAGVSKFLVNEKKKKKKKKTLEQLIEEEPSEEITNQFEMPGFSTTSDNDDYAILFSQLAGCEMNLNKKRKKNKNKLKFLNNDEVHSSQSIGSHDCNEIDAISKDNDSKKSKKKKKNMLLCETEIYDASVETNVRTKSSFENEAHLLNVKSNKSGKLKRKNKHTDIDEITGKNVKTISSFENNNQSFKIKTKKQKSKSGFNVGGNSGKYKESKELNVLQYGTNKHENPLRDGTTIFTAAVSPKTATSNTVDSSLNLTKKKKKKPKHDSISADLNKDTNFEGQTKFETIPSYDGEVLLKKMKSWKSSGKHNFRATPYSADMKNKMKRSQ